MTSAAHDRITPIPDFSGLGSGKEAPIFMVYVDMFKWFAPGMGKLISSIAEQVSVI